MTEKNFSAALLAVTIDVGRRLLVLVGERGRRGAQRGVCEWLQNTSSPDT